jgi:hypothetical protein
MHQTKKEVVNIDPPQGPFFVWCTKKRILLLMCFTPSLAIQCSMRK